MNEALLSVPILTHIMPALSADAAADWLAPLGQAMTEFGILTPLRAAAFLAQAAHESGQLDQLVENLNYSADGLLATWPTRFTHELAVALARQPEKIANHVYGGRGGNGPESSGDGWSYRGRGLFSLTFRPNYRQAGHHLVLPLEAQPDQVATPLVAARTAGLYWQGNGLSSLADAGRFDSITRRINGGMIGQAQRVAFYARAKQALGIP